MKPKEARELSLEKGRKRQLEYLEETCRQVKKLRGSIKILFQYDYWVELQINKCYTAGCSSNDVRKILQKYDIPENSNPKINET